jgi:hypothetical protein
MSVTILETAKLPEFLGQVIKTPMVTVRRLEGEIILSPVTEIPDPGLYCNFFGMLKGGHGMVDEIIAERHRDAR